VVLTKVDKLKLEEEESTKKRFSIYALENKDPQGAPVSPSRRPRAEDDSPLSPSRATRNGGRQRSLDLEEKAEISSSLIAQHFSILRELSQYCSLLKENVGIDPDAMNLDDAWRNFSHLVELLEAGCDFLHYPIKL
jgi:hypothetical protein